MHGPTESPGHNAPCDRHSAQRTFVAKGPAQFGTLRWYWNGYKQPATCCRRCAECFAGWAAKFKKYAVLAGVNEPKKSCHGVRKARAEIAACADCTGSQMMAMFGWTDPKMPAHYIAQANREKLGISGMEKIVAFDESQSLDEFMPLPERNSAGTSGANKVVTLRSNIGKKCLNFN